MVAVIIPVRNGARVIGEQLTALEQQKVNDQWRVFVVDNGSIDTTLAVVTPFLERLPLTIVHAVGRPGVNVARNAGAQAATRHGAQVLLFCDADDVVDDGWIAAMARASRRWDAWGGALDRTRLSDPALFTQPRSMGLSTWKGYLPFASGCNLGVRSDVWQRLGGFDEEFRGGGDDVDFCWRVQLAGGTLGFAEDAVVHHRERGTYRELVRQFRDFGRQDPHLYRKHREHGMPPSTLPDGARAWARLILNAPRYTSTPHQRGEWVRKAARCWGRIEGSVLYRIRYL
jgi:GT2 family glycosyltransferase